MTDQNKLTTNDNKGNVIDEKRHLKGSKLLLDDQIDNLLIID